MHSFVIEFGRRASAQTIPPREFNIPFQRNPFKVLCSVVGLYPVDVVDVKTVMKAVDKGKGNKAMHIRRLALLPLKCHRNPEIAIATLIRAVLNGLVRSIVDRAPLIARCYGPRNGPDSTFGVRLYEFVPRY